MLLKHNMRVKRATRQQSTASLQLCGNEINRIIPAKNREGAVLSSDKEQEGRWVEYL